MNILAFPVVGPVLGRSEPPWDQLEAIQIQDHRQVQEIKGFGLLREGLCPMKEAQGNLVPSGAGLDLLSTAVTIHHSKGLWAPVTLM